MKKYYPRDNLLGMDGFSTLWVRLREEAGFKNAHDFFAKSGGQKVLKLSYVNYWKIEQGRLLPKPDRLALLITCLRSTPAAKKVRELAHAYLREHLGSDTAYEWIKGLVARQEEEQTGVAREAARRVMRERVYHVNHGQYQAILKTYASYWVWIAMSESRGAVQTQALSKLLKIPKKEIEEAGKILAAKKLMKIEPDGGLTCPLYDKHVVLLPLKLTTPQIQARLREYHQKMIKSGAVLAHRHWTLLRAESLEIQSYFPHLNEAVRGAGVYSTNRSSDTTALFLVEGNVFRLTKF